MGQLRILSIIVLGVALSACSGMKSLSVLDQVDQGKVEYKGERPACEIQVADYELKTQVTGFEMVSSTGLSMGFNLLTGFLKLFNLSFESKEGRLFMSMSLSDPMAPQFELMNSLGSASMKGRGFQFGIDFHQISAGFSHYYQTPIATLAEKGLRDTLNQVDTKMAQRQEAWKSRVLAVPARHEVIIGAGTAAGVRLGDEFAIYNVEHIWEKEPCTSAHVYEKKTTPGALAVGVVTDVRNMAALLTLKRKGDELADPPPVDKGARVEILKLIDNRTSLARTMEIGEVRGAEMQFDNGGKVDLTKYMREQINAVVHSQGYVIHVKNP